jgi:hypothetical protein
MTRKEFLTTSTSAGVAFATSGTALHSCNDSTVPDKKRPVVFASLEEAVREFEQIEQAARANKRMEIAGQWNLAQHLTHCAQSIEFSMNGFPEPKSWIFQKTAGALAFALFSARGAMSHNTNEPIPGAAALSPELAVEQAFERLRTSVEAFQRYDKDLAAHFAYGKLSKAEYAKAHTMHLADHAARIVYEC